MSEEGKRAAADIAARLVQLQAERDALFAAAKAALAYDAAIRGCADDPERMASFCTAQGDDLDALYDDWQSKSASAVAKVERQS